MTHDEMTELLARIAAHNPLLYPLFSLEFGDAVVGVERTVLLDTCRDLKDAGFDRLGMVTAVDRGEAFVMVYRLHARSLSAAIFVKTQLPRLDAWVDSLVSVWPAALWQEREAYDLFGVEFQGHPDLRRILLPDDFEGHPLRKDYDDQRMIRRPDYI